MSKAREKVTAWVQKKRPTWTREQCEARADKLIAIIKADARTQVEAEQVEAEIDAGFPEPTDDESTIKRRVRQKAGLK